MYRAFFLVIRTNSRPNVAGIISACPVNYMNFEVAHEAPKVSARNNSERWDRILLRREIKELKREQAHLLAKGRERDLTAWEVGRLEQLVDETMELLVEFRKFATFS